MNNFNTTPAFRLVFSTVVGFTLLAGGTSIWLSTQDDLSPQQTQVFESCTRTWDLGIGAVLGLLGSKATDLFQSDEDDEEK